MIVPPSMKKRTSESRATEKYCIRKRIRHTNRIKGPLHYRGWRKRPVAAEPRSAALLLIRLKGTVQLRPLCDQLMHEMRDQMLAFNQDPAIGAIVLTGSEKAFAAGAKDRRYPANLHADFLESSGNRPPREETGNRRGLQVSRSAADVKLR